jgi:predicted transcriptional regulator
MMNTSIGCRIPRPLADRLTQLALATARPRSEIIRFFLAQASSEALPPSWLDAVDVERVVTGQSDQGTQRES